jgi:hypothetical protein
MFLYLGIQHLLQAFSLVYAFGMLWAAAKWYRQQPSVGRMLFRIGFAVMSLSAVFGLVMSVAPIPMQSARIVFPVFSVFSFPMIFVGFVLVFVKEKDETADEGESS